jgi:glyoxylase-like metal-dependent hydrolase (beta-lactamase superfamily II)
MIHVKNFTFNPVQENTYVLFNDNGKALIIDPGCYFTEEEKMLKNFIEENHLQPVQLLNTHCHLDHVFGNKWVAKIYGLQLFLHSLEQPVLQLAPASGKMYGLEFENYEGPLHFLSEGDSIVLDEDELQVLWVPGHSPGSICFYCAKEQFLIGGDVLFRESIGRSDLPGGNGALLVEGIRKKLFTLPNETQVYSGHGEPTTIGHEKQYNPFI